MIIPAKRARRTNAVVLEMGDHIPWKSAFNRSLSRHRGMAFDSSAKLLPWTTVGKSGAREARGSGLV